MYHGCIWCKNYQMEHQYSDRIVRLLQLYLLGDITEEERQELEDWCEEAPRNRKLFEQICQEDLFSKERYVYELVEICSRVVIPYFSRGVVEVDA